MRIEDMTIALRPRSGWEAVDLGFLMARQHFVMLWLIWWLPALPLFCLWQLVLHDYGFVALLVFWWFKPLYEQAMLFYLSRVVFGEFQSFQELRRQFFSLTKVQMIHLLTLRRFSFSRSTDMAVHLLEGLSGRQRSDRLRVLHSYAGQSSYWLTIVLYHFEALLWMGFIILAGMMIPDELEFFSSTDLWEGDGQLYLVLNQFIYVLAMSLVAPFYVSAGFALYLSARTQLEGWDIELVFRKLAYRIATSMVVMLVLVFSFYPEDGMAQDMIKTESQVMLTADESKQRIREVLSGLDFGRLESYRSWQQIQLNDEEGKPASDLEIWKDLFNWLRDVAGVFAAVAEMLLWVLVIALIIWLVHRYAHLLKFFSRWGGRAQLPGASSSVNLFRDLDLESLPDDILPGVWEEIERGDYRLALSLLYRGALKELVEEHQVNIPESATEQECVALVIKSRPKDEGRFFSQLTRSWLYLAWAGRPPELKHVSDLATNWEKIYGSA